MKNIKKDTIVLECYPISYFQNNNKHANTNLFQATGMHFIEWTIQILKTFNLDSLLSIMETLYPRIEEDLFKAVNGLIIRNYCQCCNIPTEDFSVVTELSSMILSNFIFNFFVLFTLLFFGHLLYVNFV